MPDNDPSEVPITTRLRALVVEPDERRRETVIDLLQDQGLRVLGCQSVDHGRQLFDDHALVVAPLNGDNTAVLDFIRWLRTRSGPTQPYVLGLGEYFAPAAEWHGFNEFVSPPLDFFKLHLSVEAARRWHGWTGEIYLAPEKRNSAKKPAEESTPEPEPKPAAEPEPEPAASVIVEEMPPAPVAVESILETPAKESPSVAEPHFDWSAIESTSTPISLPSLTERVAVEKLPVEQPTPRSKFLPSSFSSPLSGSSGEMDVFLHQLINEASPFGLMLLDDTANIIYSNPQLRTVLGVSVEEAGGLQAWLELGCAAESGDKKKLVDEWWERVWRRRYPLVLTMRNAESILKEIEFRPSKLSGERLLVAIFDVTDARREEEAMRASEARFRGLFNQTPAGMVVLNAAGSVTDVNTAFEMLTGSSRLEVRRSGMDRFFPPEDLQKIRQQTIAVRTDKDCEPFVTRLKGRDGRAISVLCTMSVIKNAAGTAVFTAYSLLPISEKLIAPQPPVRAVIPVIPVPAAEPLPSQNPTLSRLMAAVPDLVLELGADLKVISQLPSRDFQSIQSKSEEIIGQPFASAFPSLCENLPLLEMTAQLDESLESEVRCDFKARLHAEESPRILEARMVALPGPEEENDSQKPESRYGLVIRDLTRTASQLQNLASTSVNPVQELSKEENAGFPAIEMLKQAVIMTNSKGRINKVNSAAVELFGYSREELLESGLYQLFLPDQPKEFADRISEQINQHQCWIGTTTFYHKDGREGTVSVELVPCGNEEPQSFIGFMSEVKHVEVPVVEEKKEGHDGLTESPAPEAESTVTLHRARNDLQVLSSLLSMQAAESGMEDRVKHALQEGKDRVGAVALVYRILDGSTGMVDLSKYAAEMGGQILRSHEVEPGRIQLITPNEPRLVTQRLAISLGLILQELLNSAIGHSFPNGTGGKVTVGIVLGAVDGVLTVKDNGPFQTEEIRARRFRGFGWQVVESLAEQVRGELKVLSDLDNEVRLRFRVDR